MADHEVEEALAREAEEAESYRKRWVRPDAEDWDPSPED